LPRQYSDGRCRHNFFNKIITGDETWCLAYDHEKGDRVLKGFVTHPLGWRNWNSKGPASRPCR